MWRESAKWWFGGGEVLGGAATGFLAVVLGSLLRPVVPESLRWAVVGLALVVVAGHELGWYRLWLPQNARQVPQSIIDAGGRVGALQFGFEMGTGLRTFMTSALPHLLLVTLLLVTPWWAGLAVGAAFGAGRATMALTRLAWRPVGLWDDALLVWYARIKIVLTAAAAVCVVGLWWASR